MKKIVVSLLLLLAGVIQAQNEERFKFEEEFHDFGVVEEGVKATYQFKFKNIGKDTILMEENSVRPGCGCTKGAYTKSPILPGDTGSITTIFNTSGRLGSNSKSVTVTYKTTTKVLMFKIVVVAPDTSKSKPNAKQLKKSPVFGLEKYSHDFGKAIRGQKLSLKVALKNSGKDSLRIASILSGCSCVTYKLYADTKDKKGKLVTALPAGKTGYLELEYTPNFNGKGYDVVTFTTNDLKDRRKAIRLSVELVDKL